MLQKILIALALATASIAAQALDFRVLNSNAIAYEAGFKQSTPQFILKAGTPVELILSTDRWSKIREVGGSLGWVENGLLTTRNQVIVTANSADVRQAPNENSPVVFAAQKDVLLEFQGTAVDGWLKVRHRDGATGYVSARMVWGFN